MLFFLFLFLGSDAYSPISFSVNGASLEAGRVIFGRIDDRIRLHCEAGGNWYRFFPDTGSLEQGPGQFVSISYFFQNLNSTSTDFILANLEPGVYYFGKVQDTDLVHPLKCKGPPQEEWEFPIIQIRIRKDDTYLGYLTEMIGVPFVLPPLRLPGGIHQTDAATGVDCAELAIYGRRRMGHPVPYLGPRGIINFLKPIPPDSLSNGSVIHFGDQVSILYEDKAPLGKLNAEDLLIQSYEAPVQIISFRESGFWNREYRLFKWE